MGSSELNDFQLNADRLARLAQMVLDSRKLDQSLVGGNVSYNASDFVYNSTVSTYDGVFTNLADASATLGGLSASVQSVPVVVVSASSSLGALTSAASSSVSHNASLSASLGSLDSTASSIPQILPVLNADLGSLSSVVTATVTHVATAQAVLDGLTATANTTPTIKPVFMGSLGTLEATATATVIPPTPPEPEIPGYGSNRPYPAPPIRQPKVEPLPQPPTPVIVETPPARPVRMPATITATTSQLSPAFSVSVQAQVEWSILEDEAELLLML
jgi:hypothetical protein